MTEPVCSRRLPDSTGHGFIGCAACPWHPVAAHAVAATPPDRVAHSGLPSTHLTSAPNSGTVETAILALACWIWRENET